jgi:hypothetical protein
MTEEQPAEQPASPAIPAAAPPELSRPSAQRIFQRSKYAQATLLMTQIIGFAGYNVTPERLQDIDSILWLLESCGFLPEEPNNTPYVALVTMIWARMPVVTEGSATLELDETTIKTIGEAISSRIVEIVAREFRSQNEMLFKFTKQFNDIAETELKPPLETQTEWLKKILARVNAPQIGEVDGEAVARKVSAEIQQRLSGLYLALLVMAGWLGLLAGIFIGPGLLKLAHFL